LNVVDLGRRPYLDALGVMETVRDQRIRGEIDDTLIFVEHDPVYTVGRTRGAENNILNPLDVPIVKVARGGDVTFHGPGQIVGYPIMALPEHRHDLHGFMRGLEEMMIRTLGHYGVRGSRDDRNTGVWVDGAKIMAIGIGAKRWVTWHGFALNVDTDLRHFERINPCGMASSLVTRLVDHVHPLPSSASLKTQIGAELRSWWEAWTAPVG